MIVSPNSQHAFDIIVIAPNSAVDSLYVLPHLEIGHVHRALQVWHTAGGKGNNMARAVVKLGGSVLSLGIVGGTSGQLIVNELVREGIAADVTWTTTETRRCLTISSQDGSKETTVVLEAGKSVGAQARESLFAKALHYADQSPFLTLNGSLPPDFPDDYYAQIITTLKENASVRIAVDCTGEPLRLSAQAGPWLIKVNLQEFQHVFAAHQSWDWRIPADVFQSLQRVGLEYLIITDGRRGAYVFRKQVAPFRVFTTEGTLVSTAGAGDTFLAGLLLALERGQPIESAARYAAAAAVASLQQIVCGALETTDVERFLRLTQIENPIQTLVNHESLT
jgi:1-phosphofructokinase family hexose kinase